MLKSNVNTFHIPRKKQHGSLLVLATIGASMWAIFDSSWNRNRYSTNAVVARRHDTDFPLLNTPIAEPEIVQIISEEAIFHVLS